MGGMTGAGWYWVRGGSARGVTVSEQFSSQADAEAFMSEEWESLLDSGVEEASLIHGGELVYGPMPLSGQ